MANISKRSLRELQSFSKHSDRCLQKRSGSYPPEDWMEQAADLLEDDFSRRFIITVLGFVRLLQPFFPEKKQAIQHAITWLEWRYPQANTYPDIRAWMEQFLPLSLSHINWNITFKRMSAILSRTERSVMAQGLVDILSDQDPVPNEKLPQLEDFLTNLLLSESAAAELLDQKNLLR